MGRIARLLSFVRVTRNGAKVSDVKFDPGGGFIGTAENFHPAGDDSHPLPEDYLVLESVTGAGREAVIGYVDTKNTPKALAGDKRIYARDAGGAVVVDVWLKNTGEATIANATGSFTLMPDGSIKGTNASGSFELQAGGDFVVNGATIDTAGNITSPATITGVTVAGSSSVTAAGKEIAGHGHSQGNDSAGDTQVDTGPNN